MRLGVNYEGLDTAESMKTYRAAAALGRRAGLTLETGRIYLNMSFPLSARGDYKRVTEVLDSALYFLDRSKDPDTEFRRGQVIHTLGITYRYQGDFKKYIEYMMKAVAIFEKANHQRSVLNTYLNISMYYKDIAEYETMYAYTQKALTMARKLKRKDDIFKSYVFVMYALNQMNDYKQAKLYLDSCVMSYVPVDDFAVMVSYHLVGGLMYMNLYGQDSLTSHLDKAEAHFREGNVLGHQYNSRFNIVQTELQLARILSLRKKYGEAERSLRALLTQLKENEEPDQWTVAHDYLSRNYAESGQYKKAYESYIEYRGVQDSLSSEKNKRYAADLEKKYEAEKRDLQIKQLITDKELQQLTIQKKNIINYVLVGGAFTLAAIFLLTFRSYKQRQRLQQQRINELETEKQLLATEAVLKGEERERTRLAQDLHDGLGGMLSGIKYALNTMKGNLIMTPENQQAFERSIDMLDSSIKEMRRVAHNMMPEALIRFGLDTALLDFCNEIDQSGALKVTYQSIGMEGAVLDQTTAITLYRVVQELIHNTMKHASATTALVQVSKTGRHVTMTVEDNGIGFDNDTLKMSEGMGWANIRHRIKFLKGTWDVNSRPGEGTSVHIELDV